MFKKTIDRVVVGSVLTAVGVGAANAAVDISAITAAGTDIAAVGGAVFLIFIAVKVFQWVRKAL